MSLFGTQREKQQGAVSVVLTALLLFVSACRHAPELTADEVTATPAFLEVVGGRVPVVINGRVPEKFLQPNALLTLTPRLTFDGGARELTAMPLRLRGEKRKGEEQEISYDNGGNFSIRAAFPYDSTMQRARLYLDVKRSVGRRAEETLPSLAIGRGTLATSVLSFRALRSLSPIFVEGEYQKRLDAARDQAIRSLLKEVALRNSVLSPLATADFVRTLGNIDTDAEAMRLDPIPASQMYFGADALSAERRQHHLIGADAAVLRRITSEADADTAFSRRDRFDFYAFVKASNLAVRDSLLAVLSTYVEPAGTNVTLQRHRASYDSVLYAVLPRLRRYRSLAVYDITGRSERELLQTAQRKPAALNAEELLLCIVLTDNETMQAACYEAAVRRAPTDYRVLNNIAAFYMTQDENKRAEIYIDNALMQRNKVNAVNVNKALLRLSANDEAEAERYLNAAGSIDNARQMRGALALLRGDFAEAADQLTPGTSNMTALAQLLTRDYRAAATTLRSIFTPDATTYYLKAVLAARTNDGGQIAPNLQRAFALDASLRTYAENDAEFTRYTGRDDLRRLFVNP